MDVQDILARLVVATRPAGGSPKRGGSREHLLALVGRTPGLTVSELARRLGLTVGTTSYHVERLAAQGALVTRDAGRRRLVFGPDGARDTLSADERALLRGRTTRLVAAAVLDAPGISIAQLVARLDESPRVVYYHVKLLRQAGLLRSTSLRHYRGLSVAPRVEALLAED